MTVFLDAFRFSNGSGLRACCRGADPILQKRWPSELSRRNELCSLNATDGDARSAAGSSGRRGVGPRGEPQERWQIQIRTVHASSPARPRRRRGDASRTRRFRQVRNLTRACEGPGSECPSRRHPRVDDAGLSRAAADKGAR